MVILTKKMYEELKAELIVSGFTRGQAVAVIRTATKLARDGGIALDPEWRKEINKKESKT